MGGARWLGQWPIAVFMPRENLCIRFALAVFQANGEEDFCDAVIEVLETVHASVECEIFPSCEVVVEQGLMRDESDVFAYLMRIASGVYTADPDIAR